jgi:hypothetical protein
MRSGGASSDGGGPARYSRLQSLSQPSTVESVSVSVFDGSDGQSYQRVERPTEKEVQEIVGMLKVRGRAWGEGGGGAGVLLGRQTSLGF